MQRLPLIFFARRTIAWRVATSVEEASAEPRLGARGLGFAIPAWRVDGMDPLAVMLAMEQAVAHARGGHGPAIVEAEVYRFFHQNGVLPGSAFGYRSKAEEDAWRRRDPVDRVARELVSRGLLDQATVVKLRGRAVEVNARHRWRTEAEIAGKQLDACARRTGRRRNFAMSACAAT